MMGKKALEAAQVSAPPPAPLQRTPAEKAPAMGRQHGYCFLKVLPGRSAWLYLMV